MRSRTSRATHPLTAVPDLEARTNASSSGARGSHVRARARRAPWPFSLYQTAIGKKYAIATSGIVLMTYVFLHMVGNLKLYLGPQQIDRYADWLRTMGEPAVPRTVVLWIVRAVLTTAFAVHIHAAWSLARTNRRARPDRYRRHTDYVAANYSSRTMRWTGVIVGLFVVFHLLDLTWGTANPHFVRGDVYNNVVTSFHRWPVASVYIAANVALGFHLYHGAWSLFQSMGWNHPRWNIWRRWFAGTFAIVVSLGNISFPIAVLTHVIT
jgi:succinate dehydrogenase / fumarate reductase cytochrome b subunit